MTWGGDTPLHQCAFSDAVFIMDDCLCNGGCPFQEGPATYLSTAGNKEHGVSRICEKIISLLPVEESSPVNSNGETPLDLARQARDIICQESLDGVLCGFLKPGLIYAFCWFLGMDLGTAHLFIEGLLCLLYGFIKLGFKMGMDVSPGTRLGAAYRFIAIRTGHWECWSKINKRMWTGFFFVCAMMVLDDIGQPSLALFGAAKYLANFIKIFEYLHNFEHFRFYKYWMKETDRLIDLLTQ